MAIRYQFNKISLQFLRKQLKVREGALPTLKNKESALRSTVKKYKDDYEKILNEYNTKEKQIKGFLELWGEFPKDIVSIKEVKLNFKKIAGVKVPFFSECMFEVKEYSAFLNPSWFVLGIKYLKELLSLKMKLTAQEEALKILEYARKKTTQKVNLYEKVQIPGFKAAIIRIKRFLEDIENLDKASQKITKGKNQALEINA